MDPGAVGISRAHGCSCGDCVFGVTPTSLDDSSSSLPLCRSLCPTRAAARQVLHAQELRSHLATSDPFGPWSRHGEFPLFPTLAGLTLEKVAVVGSVVGTLSADASAPEVCVLLAGGSFRVQRFHAA